MGDERQPIRPWQADIGGRRRKGSPKAQMRRQPKKELRMAGMNRFYQNLHRCNTRVPEFPIS